ncbi:MAG: stage V sporulation protein AE [Bacillota bacterium]
MSEETRTRDSQGSAGQEEQRVRVIAVTDGDEVARHAVETAAKRLGLRTISRSAGNPTPYTGRELVQIIKTAKQDPVLVMLDDRGKAYKAQGEQALEYLAHCPEIDLIGAVAVASNTLWAQGVPVDFSIDRNGELVHGSVDKDGFRSAISGSVIYGDTVDVLRGLGIPIVGMGDPGKQGGRDNYHRGAPVTTKALKSLLSELGEDAEVRRRDQSENHR